MDKERENGSSPHRCSLHHPPSLSLSLSLCLTERSQLGEQAANQEAETERGGGEGQEEDEGGGPTFPSSYSSQHALQLLLQAD